MYKLTNSGSIIRLSDGANIPISLGNSDYQKFVSDAIEPEPADPPPEPIYTCSPWQIRKALNNQNLRATIETYVENSIGYDIKDGWKYATEFISNDPFLITAGQAIGMTPLQIKELVQYASTL